MTTGMEFAQPKVRRLVGSALAAAERRQYRRFIEHCMTHRHCPSLATVEAPTVDEGQVLQATDRAYEVTSRGWRRVETDHEVPAHKSQIRLTPLLRGQYPKGWKLYRKNGILVGHTGQRITSEDVAKFQ